MQLNAAASLLAQMNDEVDAFYQKAGDEDILFSCILPWREAAINYIPADGSRATEPVVIRKGLGIDRILPLLSDSFPSWDYRRGTYH
jgi:hypothetical protein